MVKSTIKYVFMGTPGFAAVILEKFSEAYGDPVLVCTQPAREVGRGRKLQPTAVQTLAQNKRWRCLSTENINAEESLAVLKEVHPDYILVAAFGQILKNEVLHLPKKHCLNVHASLLPKWRGAAPIQRAIVQGDFETGVTIQKMARKLDTGDILLQKKTPIQRGQTSDDLMQRLSEIGAEALIEAVHQIQTGTAVFTPQEDSQATYASKLTKEESMLDFQLSAQNLERRVYGLQPLPVAELSFEGKRLKVFAAKAIEAPSNNAKPAPGEVVTDGKTYINIGCGGDKGTVLALLEVQPENKKRMPVNAFLNGLKGK